MTPELYGLPFRSNAETFVAGATVTIKPDYMSQATQWDAAEVWGMKVVFTGTVGGVAGGALGRDAAKLLSLIRLKTTDDVYNVSGAGSRIVEQVEFGSRQADPADVTSGTTNATYSYILRIPFASFRSKRPRDTAISLVEFMNGGEFAITFAAANPTGWAAVQADWRVQVFPDIREGRRAELKVRRRIKEEAAVLLENEYQVNGSLRGAYLSSVLATTGYTDLSTLLTLNSRTLKWPAGYQTRMLVDQYREEQVSAGANDEFLRAATAAYAIAMPKRNALVGRMPDMKSLHLDFITAVPASARLITDTVIERNSETSARILGYDNPSQAQAAIANHGVVVGEGDNFVHRAFDKKLSARLPIRVKPGGVAK